MRRKPSIAPRPRQQTPEELQASLLDFVRRKFYAEGAEIEFRKDRPRLLKWVVLWPARWMDERGVSFPANRYQEIVIEILMDALRFGRPDLARYRPAWLLQVIQSHFRHQEERYYEEGKALRNRLGLLMPRLEAGATSPGPDPVVAMATAHRLLKSAPKRPQMAPVNGQLNLL